MRWVACCESATGQVGARVELGLEVVLAHRVGEEALGARAVGIAGPGVGGVPAGGQPFDLEPIRVGVHQLADGVMYPVPLAEALVEVPEVVQATGVRELLDPHRRQPSSFALQRGNQLVDDAARRPRGLGL